MPVRKDNGRPFEGAAVACEALLALARYSTPGGTRCRAAPSSFLSPDEDGL